MELSDILNYEYIEINVNNGADWHKTEVISATENTVTVVLPNGLGKFFVSDDVKCRVTDGNSIYNFDGEISDIIFKHPQSLVIFVSGQIKRYYDHRKEKRYYTSLLVEVYKLKKIYGYVKDVSTRDITLRSQGFLERGDNVEIVLYFEDGKKNVRFDGRVIKKVNVENYREYVVEIETIEPLEYDKFISLIEILDNQVSVENRIIKSS